VLSNQHPKAGARWNYLERQKNANYREACLEASTNAWRLSTANTATQQHAASPQAFCREAKLYAGLFTLALSSATISCAAWRALSNWSGGKEIAPTRAWPPPP